MASDVIVTALQELEDAEGRLTPRTVVDAARNPEHPLHDQFEWNDSVAAEKHRLNTARRLLRLKYNVSYQHVEFRIPRYIRDPDLPPTRAGYRNTMRVASDHDMAHEALVAEFRRASDALRRARHLGTAFGLADIISDLEERVATVRADLDQHAASMQ